MFSRSKKKPGKKVAVKSATISIIEPEQKKEETPAIDLSKAKITVLEPENSGLKILVDEREEDE